MSGAQRLGLDPLVKSESSRGLLLSSNLEAEEIELEEIMPVPEDPIEFEEEESESTKEDRQSVSTNSQRLRFSSLEQGSGKSNVQSSRMGCL